MKATIAKYSLGIQLIVDVSSEVATTKGRHALASQRLEALAASSVVWGVVP